MIIKERELLWRTTQVGERGQHIIHNEGKGYSCTFTVRGRKAEYMDTDSGGYGFNFHSEVGARSCPENEDDGKRKQI